MAISFTSCGTNNQEQARQQFLARQPDTAVTMRLSLYDSLRNLATANLTAFFDSTLIQGSSLSSGAQASYFINSQGTLESFHHRKGAAESLPGALENDLLALFSKIGSNNIFGFEIQPDSTFKVLLRNEYVPQFHLDIRERLTWVSANSSFVQEDFMKELAITDHWTYLIWYDKRGGW
ncbi:MAG: hypothetical protein EOO15_09265 [Chitinophagaceae bacterium]|nr:MAG: hypothetical protein EOO15_09265 [Chitinophagaceae bacterium]